MYRVLLYRPTGGIPKRGLVGYWKFDERKNLLKYSQQFDNTVWGNSGCTITPNAAIAPDGTTTADKIALTVGAAQQLAESVMVTPGETYTYSAWVKLGTATDLKYAVYNVTGSADIIAPTAYGATGEWARYAATFTVPAGCVSVSVRPVKNAAQADGATAWLWGAQINPGPVPTAYYPTTNKQLLMDYSRPRKNLLLPNQANGGEDGTTTGLSVITGGETITSDATEHWQGSRCIKVVTPNVTNQEGVGTLDYRLPVLPNTVFTGSAWVKGSGTVKAKIYGYNEAGSYQAEANGPVVTLSSEWQRVSVAYTVTENVRLLGVAVVTTPKQSTTFYVDGFQIEEGSVATDWQAPPNHGILGSAFGADTNDPTWGAPGLIFAADDYVDIPQMTFAGAFSVVWVAERPSTATGADIVLADKNDATNKLGYTSAAATLFVRIGNTTSPTVAQPTGYHSVAVVRDAAGAVSIWTNGVLAGSPAFTAPGAVNFDRIGMDDANAFDGTIAVVGFWDRALSDAEIARTYRAIKNDLAGAVVLP